VRARPVTPGQRHSDNGLDTVRRVRSLLGESEPGDAADVTADKADGEPAASGPGRTPGDLPLRPVSDHQPRQRIRRMDDPEILERVLEGLVNLT
jgi:hypothetical protein